ncbi:MAG: heavy-metal-associated domain-containing protein [Sphingobacteriaceae bacterium]|jgi:copper chaperone CopZ
MKAIFLILATILLSFKIQAQSSVVTSTLSVKGNCEECKERIENAADIKGVKVCKWNSETKVASITYDSSKTNMEAIEKAIAKAGYETSGQKADPKAYAKLPKCCKYSEGVCDEKK